VKRILAGLVIVGALGALVASKMLSSTSSASPKQEKGSQPAPEVLVTTSEVEPAPLEDRLTTTGRLVGGESITVRNEVGGKVVGIDFEEGEAVQRGELLLRMRNDTLRAELKAKKQELELARKRVDRQKKVLQEGGISQQEFDILMNRKRVLEAEVDRIRAEIDRTVVRAPFDGVVGLRTVSPGAVIAAQTDIAELVQTDPLKLEFTVAERYAAALEVGETIQFRTYDPDRQMSAGGRDPYRGMTESDPAGPRHEAEIYALEPSLHEASHALQAKARVPNPEGAFQAGGFAKVTVTLRTIDEALTVPATAVMTSGETNSVWVERDGKATKQTVKTGLRTERRVQIVEGLKSGDRVVVTNRQQVKEGATLKEDTSEDRMDVDTIEPDPDKPGNAADQFRETDNQTDTHSEAGSGGKSGSETSSGANAGEDEESTSGGEAQ
jgi:membrane fusion protein (multidrug efflux system)